MLNGIRKDNRGATMVEFTIIFMLLMLLTFGIAEFSVAFWQWNGAEKATQIGARLAVISDPVATELAAFECATSSVTPGAPCSDPGAASFGTVVCQGSSQSCTNGFTFSTDAFNALVSRMQQIFPLVQAQNVIVEYADVGLGFAGRGSPVPAVTVRLTGMTFNFIALSQIAGLGAISMPDFRTTLSGEDLNSTGTT